MKTKQITINFGLVASPYFPAVARERVLASPIKELSCTTQELLHAVKIDVLDALDTIGCTVKGAVVFTKANETTLVTRVAYPWQAEQDACKPPSVLKYEPYMRLYEVAAYFAQDCVAVLPDGEQGLLVGAGADKWGAFDSTKFITLE